jgi:flavodoxin
MKSLIIVYSYHHNNTLKIANEISDVLGSEVKSPLDTNQEELMEYDVVGLGAGIDSGQHYKELLDFAVNIEKVVGKQCFIFSTSAVQGEDKVNKDHFQLREVLNAKGYNILGEFSCKGFNTNSFLKFIGGMNKKHPNTEDIVNAREFASKIMNDYEKL